MFFDRCSSKTSCFREIGVQLPCLCANLIIWSWKFKKVFFLLKCCFGFCVVLVLKLHPDRSYYLTSTMDKTHHGSIISLFYVQVLQLFSYIGVVLITNLFHCYWWIIYFGYSVNCNAKWAFMIIFLIWKDLLNCLRCVGTMVITATSGSNSLKIFFTKQLLITDKIFYCFDVCPVQQLQIFQVQAKTSTLCPVFPDYLSVSYD